jgi:hypothetical protein
VRTETLRVSDTVDVHVHPGIFGVTLVFTGGAWEEAAHGWALVYVDRLFARGLRSEIDSTGERSEVTIRCWGADKEAVLTDVRRWAAHGEVGR